MADNKVIFEVVATAKGIKVVEKQTEQLAKSTDRAERSTRNLEKSRDRYNRREKGAAQISSNSTKNFSKMQQSIDGGGGGGGLVRAYALLAANVFALTAAFGLLSRSAQIDTLTQSMERLSATGGASISAISKNLVEASGGAIAFANSMQQVALATSAGLGQEQILQLTTVAKGASIALGRNLADSLDRIFRGAIKLEPELLDEIGLFVRVDEESSKYARTLGKSVTSLTQYEKRQAFLNGVIEQGTKKFKDFADEVDPDPYTKLAAALGDIAQNVTSFVNKALGPLVSFLAESRGLLFAVFAGIATILLKQAVPAISQFTRNLEINAQQTLQDRDIFIKSQEAKVAAAKTAAIALKDTEIKAQKDIAAASRATRDPKDRFVSKAKGAMDPKVLDKELGALDRQRVIRKRILDLEKSQSKVKGKNAALVEAELNDLRAEERELRKVVLLEEQRAKIKASPARAGKGTIADIENQRSLNAAIIAGGTASVLTTAQTQGLRAGFSEFFGSLKSGEVQVDGNTKKIKGLSKGTFALKGGIGLLGASFSKLLMVLGPIGIGLSIIAPFLPAIARATGLVTEESIKLNKTFKQLDEQQKALANRFDIQVTSIKNTELAYVETRKAILAYNTTNLETFKLINQSSKDLAAFQRNLSGLGAAWEGFKSIFGLDKESKVIKSQTEAVKDSIQAAILVEDEGMLKIFEKLSIETEGFSVAVKNAESAQTAFDNAQKNLNTSGSTRLKILNRLAEKEGTGKLLTERQKQVQQTLNETELEYIRTLSAKQKADKAVAKSRKELTVTELQAQGAEKAGIALTETRVELEAKRVSALEGSREAVSKFQAAFQQTTKVDEITSSLNQLKANILDAEDTQATADFFATFDKEPIALIFTEEQIKKIKEGGKDAKKEFNDVVTEFNNLRTSIASSKDKLALLNAEAKKYNFASKVGGEAATLLAAKQTEIAEQQRDIAKNEMIAALRSQGVSEAQAQTLSLLTEESQIREKAKEMGKDEIAIQKIVNEFIKSQNAELEYQFTLNTQNARQKQAQAAADQKVTDIAKEAAKIEAERLTIAAKQKAFRETGTTTIRGKDEFNLELETARESLRIAKDEAEIKKALIEAEFILLRERLKLVDMDEGKRAALLANLNNAEKNAIANVDDNITNMEGNIGVKVMEGFKKGLEEVKSGDFLSGISTAITAAGATEGDGGSKITTAENINLAKTALEGYRDTLKSLGPEGEAVVAFADGALQIADSFNTFTTSLDKADKLKAVGDMIGGVGQILAASSKQQIAEIDQQIEAEKRRDGQSAQSLAKIAALEKKKDAMARKAFEQQKKVQMAVTIANTAAAIMAAVAPPPLGLGPAGIPMAVMLGAMGALQLAVIAKTKYAGGSQSEAPKPNTSLEIGGRSSAVDVAKGTSAGELNYLRGGRTTGNDLGGAGASFPGGAMGRRGYANGGEGIMVGERGPEVITPSAPVDITPNYALGGTPTNVNFSITTLDASGVEDVLTNQRGNIIRMIREAANENGELFLENVDPTVYGGGG